ncbi:MAG TPA: hypothetical protein VGH57_15740 [Amycolatopsis sp.]|jgi:hypothetical protein
MGQTLPVEFTADEVEEIQREAAAAGRSVQDFVRETLMVAVTSRGGRRCAALDHALEASTGLNERLAR